MLSMRALTTAIGPVPLRASSHMDAPLIMLDHAANTTDVYAFVAQRNGVKYLDVTLVVYLHQELGVGPNKYGFDANVLYQLLLANPTTGADLVAYRFSLPTATRRRTRSCSPTRASSRRMAMRRRTSRRPTP